MMHENQSPPELDASPLTPEGSSPSGGLFKPIVDIFFEPAAAFRSLAVRPTWIWAAVITILVVMASQVVISSRIDMEDVIRRSMAARQQNGPELTEAQMEQAVKAATVFGRVSLLASPLVVPAILALLAAIYLGLLRLIGSEIGFKPVFSTVIHASLPAMVVKSALTLVVVLQRASIDPTRMGGLLKSNLGALLPEGTAKPLVALASMVDVFNIWQWVLLVMGFTLVARVRRNQAIGVVAVAWGAWTLVRVGLAFLR